MRPVVYSRRDFLELLVAAGAAWGMGGPRKMTWAAPVPSHEAFRLVFFTDLHARLEWDTPLALEMAARAINNQAADLVLGGGDFITEGFESSAEKVSPRWDVVMEMWNSLRGRKEPAIGNHDLVAAAPADGSPPSPDPRAIFRSKFGVSETYRTLEAGGCHIVLLDSIQVTGGERLYRGEVSEPQLKWLAADLEGVHPDTPVILISHIPLLTAFYQAVRGATEPAPDHRVVVNNREVLKLFEGRNLLLVLQGHLHVEEMLRWRRTTFITGGAVSGSWWRGPRWGTDAGFGVVTLRQGRVDWEYHSYGWRFRRPPEA